MNAHRQAIAVSIALLLFSAGSHAQQELTGAYQGDYKFKGPKGRILKDTVTLEIASVSNGAVTGTFKAVGEDCPGDYAVSGKYANDKFKLKRSPGTITGCGDDDLFLSSEAGKLVGRVGEHHLELSK